MPNRFIRRLGLRMSVYLLAAATGSVVMAEAPVRAEEGKVEAIAELAMHFELGGEPMAAGCAGNVGRACSRSVRRR